MNFKIITWNVNSIKIRLNHLRQLITKYQPDIVCLQELKCRTEKFPYDKLNDLPYNLYVHGQNTYNGVAILSTISADKVVTNFADNPIPEQARFIECSFNTRIGNIRVISLYAPNGGVINSNKFVTKLRFYDAFIKYINHKKSFKQKLFICADYNIAPFDIDVYSPDQLINCTGFSLAERKKMRIILNNGFVDHFRVKYPTKKEFSWWDYRKNSFVQNKGMRIDAIISTSNVLQNLEDCIIDDNFRMKSIPSDHAPIIGVYSI